MTSPSETQEAAPIGLDRTPLSPDEVSPRGQIKLFIHTLSAAALMFGFAEIGAGVVFGNNRALITATVVIGLAVWLQVVARPALDRVSISVSSVVVKVAIGVMIVVLAASIAQPFLGLVAAITILIPIAVALPLIEGQSLRQLLALAWAAILATGALGISSKDDSLPPVIAAGVQLLGVGLASGIVLLLLYQSSTSLKASGREFRHLLKLSADLAETTEPAVLGNLAAKHLAEAVGFDECIIHAFATETGRFAPFGSHPADRALAVAPGRVEDRPMLGRVVYDHERLMIDVADEKADPAERRRLRELGYSVCLFLPLVARTTVVGVAELIAIGPRAIDERRVALARTLAFQATMAIENGRLYQQLRQRALHDSLTGLANRSLFHDRIEHAIARLERRTDVQVSVLFIDLDEFKAVNDTLGHAKGDRLLELVAERLGTVIRPTDTAARLGGDEFALLLEDLPSTDEAVRVAQRAVDAIRAPFLLIDDPVTIGASIGVAFCSTHVSTVDEVVRQADVAMYEAKRLGKGRAIVYDPSLRGQGRGPNPVDASHPGESAG